jgi:hypothetical protein
VVNPSWFALGKFGIVYSLKVWGAELPQYKNQAAVPLQLIDGHFLWCPKKHPTPLSSYKV